MESHLYLRSLLDLFSIYLKKKKANDDRDFKVVYHKDPEGGETVYFILKRQAIGFSYA